MSMALNMERVSKLNRIDLRLADIYTSRLPNLLAYDVDHSFYPRRNALPHEDFHAVPTVSRELVGNISQTIH